jgi:hypothetical protein
MDIEIQIFGLREGATNILNRAPVRSNRLQEEKMEVEQQQAPEMGMEQQQEGEDVSLVWVPMRVRRFLHLSAP